jgi:hypothetical protein
MAHPFGKKHPQHQHRCIDDNTSLERRTIIAYTEQSPDGINLPSIEYCPKCRKYLGYSEKMETNIFDIALDFLMRYRYGFKREYLKQVKILDKK